MYYVINADTGATYSPAFVYRFEAEEFREDFIRVNAPHWTANKRNVRVVIERR